MRPENVEYREIKTIPAPIVIQPYTFTHLSMQNLRKKIIFIYINFQNIYETYPKYRGKQIISGYLALFFYIYAYNALRIIIHFNTDKKKENNILYKFDENDPFYNLKTS